jgi:oxaloacetate decarboxylase beta subunit
LVEILQGLFAGVGGVTWQHIVMRILGLGLIYLAVQKDYEPLLLGLTIGGSMTAENFLNLASLGVMALGLVAMIFATAGGLIIAKIMNLFLMVKINPMIGAAGISAFPMAGRVVAKMALAEDKQNYLLMQAMAVNISGQLCSVIAGVVVIAIIKVVIGA